MRGAHERNVLRWDIHRSLLDGEIERLERELADAGSDPERVAAVRERLDALLARRRALGPAPRPKMG